MRNIGACINCFDEFVYLLDNGLCPTCQHSYEKRRVNPRHDEQAAEIAMQLAESEKLAADYAGQGNGL